MDSTATEGTHRPQDEISLGELLLRILRFYQRFWRLLLIPPFILAVIAAYWISGRPLYSTSALLEVPDVTLEEWRQSQPFLWDQRWVARSFGGVEDAPTNARFERLVSSPTFWNNAVRYRSALSRDDSRDVPVSEVQKTRGLGLELVIRSRDESQAALTFEQLTQHIRQTLLANSLISLTRDGQQALARRPQLNIDLLQIDFEIGQQRQRIEDMRQLLKRYPELRRVEANTVVSVSDGGGKYLAPLAQIVALETTVSELQARSRKIRHDLEKLDWTAQLLSDIDPVIRNASSGQDIADKLRDNRDKVVTQRPDLPEVAQEAVQDMNLKLALADARQQAIGIKSRSALSFSPVTARKPLVIGAITLLALATVLSLLLAIHCWLRQEAEVLCWLPARLRRWLIVEVRS